MGVSAPCEHCGHCLGEGQVQQLWAPSPAPPAPPGLLPAALFLSLSDFPSICTPRGSRKGGACEAQWNRSAPPPHTWLPLPASVFLTLELPAKNKVAPKGCSESVGGCGPGGPGASVSLCGLGRACTVQKGAEGLLGTTCWHQGGQRQEGPPQILPPVLEAVGSWRADENPRFGDE